VNHAKHTLYFSESAAINNFTGTPTKNLLMNMLVKSGQLLYGIAIAAFGI
jgi:hypothetical protein